MIVQCETIFVHTQQQMSLTQINNKSMPLSVYVLMLRIRDESEHFYGNSYKQPWMAVVQRPEFDAHAQHELFFDKENHT